MNYGIVLKKVPFQYTLQPQIFLLDTMRYYQFEDCDRYIYIIYVHRYVISNFDLP